MSPRALAHSLRASHRRRSAPFAAAVADGGEARRGGARRALLAVAGLLVVAAVLVLGIALGMSLHDNPRPSGPVTVERTVPLGR